jgi:hypothetical protein
MKYFAGHEMVSLDGQISYASGAAGYVLNKIALAKLVGERRAVRGG